MALEAPNWVIGPGTGRCPAGLRERCNRMIVWCARRDSNPHDFTHCHLKAARLPIPPRALGIPAGRTGVRRINGADVTNQGWGDKAVLRLNNYLTSGDFGSICLTSTAIRLRSTSTTPEATGRLLARILTSSASVASSSMMAPRESRITWWMGMVVVPSTTMRSTLTLSRVATTEPPKGGLNCVVPPDHVMVSQWLMTAKALI